MGENVMDIDFVKRMVFCFRFCVISSVFPVCDLSSHLSPPLARVCDGQYAGPLGPGAGECQHMG